MKAMLLHFLENHVLFTTFFTSLSALYADRVGLINTIICYSIMNTQLSSAVLYHLEHSTFCVSSTVPPSSAISHVIFEK